MEHGDPARNDCQRPGAASQSVEKSGRPGQASSRNVGLVGNNRLQRDAQYAIYDIINMIVKITFED